MDLQANLPVRGTLKYVDFWPRKEGKYTDRIKLKGEFKVLNVQTRSFVPITDKYADTIFCSLYVAAALEALEVISIPRGQRDNKGHQKFVVAKPDAYIEIMMSEEKGESGKKHHVYSVGLVNERGETLPVDPAEVDGGWRDSWSGQQAAAPAVPEGVQQEVKQVEARTADQVEKARKHQRWRWKVLRATYEACIAIAEQVWDGKLKKAIFKQQALAEQMRDRIRAGADKTPTATERFDAEIPVPLFTPRDELQFLKEVANSLMIEAQRRGLEYTPDPTAKKTPVPPPEPAPPVTMPGKGKAKEAPPLTLTPPPPEQKPVPKSEQLNDDAFEETEALEDDDGLPF